MAKVFTTASSGSGRRLGFWLSLALIISPFWGIGQTTSTSLLIHPIRVKTVNTESQSPLLEPQTMYRMLAIGFQKKPGLKVDFSDQTPANDKLFDFRLEGDLTLYKDGYYMNFTLLRHPGFSSSLPVVIGKYEKFYQDLQQIVDETIKKIEAANARSWKFVGVVSTSTLNSKKQSVNEELRQAILTSVSEKLKSNGIVNIKPLGAYDKNIKQAFAEAGVNCIIELDFQLDNDNSILISPRVYLEGKASPLELPDVAASSGIRFTEMEDAITQDMVSLFQYLVTPEGLWNSAHINVLEAADTLSGSGLLDGAWAEYDAGQYLPAIFYAARYTKNNPDDYRGLMTLATVRLEQGRIKEALIELDRVIKMEPDIPTVHTVKGVIYFGDRDYAKALASFKVAYKLDPDHKAEGIENINFLLGKTYLNLDSADLAISFLKQSLAKFPDEDEAHIDLGTSYFKKNQYDKCLEELTGYLKRHPDDEDVKLRISNSYYEMGIDEYDHGHYKEAYHDFQKSQSYFDDKYVSWYMIYSLNRLGELEKSDSIFSRKLKDGILGKKPYYEQAVDLRKIYDLSRNQDANRYALKSIEYLNKQLRVNSKDTLSIWLMGNTLIWLNDFRRGLKYLQDAADLDPENTSYKLDLCEGLILINEANKVPSILTNDYMEALRKNSIDKSTYTLLLYLKYVSGLVMKDNGQQSDVNVESLKAELYAILDNKVEITGWYYDSFNDWLKKYTRASRSDIETITKRMSAQTKN